MRTVMTRVFPDPAPAMMSRGPSVVVTASRCRSLSEESKSVISSKFQVTSSRFKVNAENLEPGTCNLELFYQLLNHLELFVARVAHEFKQGRLGGGGERAGLPHLLQTDLSVLRGARRDAVGQEVNLKPKREQVVRGLVDADVRLYAAQEDLARARAFELRDELLRAAGTKRRLLYRREAFGEDGANLVGRASETFWILLCNDYGDAEELRGVCDERDARGQLREVWDVLAERLLHVYDDERRPFDVERVFVSHRSPLLLKEHLSTRRRAGKTGEGLTTETQRHGFVFSRVSVSLWSIFRLTLVQD